MSKICCFTGHRDIKDVPANVLSARLEKTIVDLVENEGVTDFRAGGARGFDSMAALAVLALKEKYPQIKLHLILPCKNQDKGFKLVEKQVYKYNLAHADSVVYVSEKYYAGVMLDRNRKLVDGADVCVAFMNHLGGGTYYTVNYARKNKVEVRNLMRA